LLKVSIGGGVLFTSFEIRKGWGGEKKAKSRVMEDLSVQIKESGKVGGGNPVKYMTSKIF